MFFKLFQDIESVKNIFLEPSFKTKALAVACELCLFYSYSFIESLQNCTVLKNKVWNNWVSDFSERYLKI